VRAPILSVVATGALEPFASLPGADLVEQGLHDLKHGIESVEALLVSIAAYRLTAVGLEPPATIASPEHRLYELLAAEDQDSAHSRYNALIRRIVSFERAAECAS
jgi:hypothetical protein